MWDGLGFFGHSDLKLSRLKGIPPKWYDRFFSKKWMAINIIVLIIILSIIAGQLEKLGDVKS